MEQVEGYLERSKSYKGFHYSVMKPEMLKYLHKRTKEMFLDIIPILEKHHIRYMMCGGSLLGAYTRGKFFDWDEDLDMCVFEEDYDRMIDVLSTEFNISGGDRNIMIQHFSTDPGYYIDWVKARDTRSHVYPDLPTTRYNGVWVDIYKLMPVKENEAEVRIAEGQLEYHKRRLERGGFTIEEYQKRVRDNRLEEKVHEAMENAKRNDKNAECYLVWSANKTLVRKEWVFPLKKYSFEGMEVTSFNKAEEYLKSHYGEKFMELPPDEMRRIGINRIEFEL